MLRTPRKSQAPQEGRTVTRHTLAQPPVSGSEGVSRLDSDLRILQIRWVALPIITPPYFICICTILVYDFSKYVR